MGCANCSAKDILNKSNIITDFSGDACGKLNSYDWMAGLPQSPEDTLLVEVQFKNTRKDFFTNKHKVQIKRGDYVSVSAASGHDIGKVTLTGKMAVLQYNRKRAKASPDRIIYRKSTPVDIERWHKSRMRERPVMIRARQLADKLNLEMKISDVEFQADGSKATFYYLADKRVDFRELIKLYAREFNIRIEMRQIGVRQEAAMVGGIGSCGNELCCSSWRTNLNSVSANAARIQELPHNIQKLTGQCGKLKCCLMYELDHYIEAQNDFPDLLLELETENGMAFPKKRDVIKKVVWYGMSAHDHSKLIPIALKRVKEIIQLNKKGIKVKALNDSDNKANVGLAAVNNEVEDFEQLDYKSYENDFEILNRTKKKRLGNKKF